MGTFQKQKIMKQYVILCLLAGLLFSTYGCKEDVKDSSTTNTKTEQKEESKNYKVPAFDGDKAYQHVEKQVAFGPRVPNSQAHKECAAWMAEHFKSNGWEVIEQDFQATAFDGNELNGVNIIAQYNPEASKRILFSAHWDTRPFADSPISSEKVNEAIDGADDGGSGVAVLMELARVVNQNPIESKDLGIDIILFDAEDYGESGAGRPESWCLGSQHWARNLHRPNYRPKYGILLDMVGSENPRFTKEGISRAAAPQVVNKVWDYANALGLNDKFVNVNTSEIIDDHYFVNTIARIPMIDIINRPAETQTGFGAYWHTHDDNLDIISKQTLKDVGQLMLLVTYREASGKF